MGDGVLVFDRGAIASERRLAGSQADVARELRRAPAAPTSKKGRTGRGGTFRFSRASLPGEEATGGRLEAGAVPVHRLFLPRHSAGDGLREIDERAADPLVNAG